MKIATLGEKGSLLKDSAGYLKATVTVNGKQYQKRVRSEEEGRQFVLSVELERDNRDELSSKQLNDACNALHFLKKRDIDVSFTDLARYYAENACEGVVGVKEAAAEYMEKTVVRVTEGTLRCYKRYISRFVEQYGDRKVASITKKDMIAYLSQYESMPPTWTNAHLCMSKFFVECEKYGYCSKNPCHLLEGPRNVKAPNRKYLTPEDAEKVLRIAEKRRRPDVAIYLALSLFGGLRPSEAFRVEQRHINMKSGYIYISPDITKTHSFKERNFKIEPTLMAWLKKYYDPKTKPVRYSTIGTLNYALREVFAQAGVSKSGDILRHSYGTYRFALTGNSAETASVMGHSESVGNKYYRGRAPKEDAERFFAIYPEDEVLTGLDAL